MRNFAKDCYTWQPSQVSIDSRNEAIKKYIIEELQTLNVDTICSVPLKSNYEPNAKEDNGTWMLIL
ncbi:conjugal transfer protein [Clostridium acidisoli]|uniref:conjugal transfer protein n=1 Tax=Clostridium acidisoli TaxID=91624 RepID=UPI001FA93B1E|nr:conjugal transfer protein [Clostridium acidisoli]